MLNMPAIQIQHFTMSIVLFLRSHETTGFPCKAEWLWSSQQVRTRQPALSGESCKETQSSEGSRKCPQSSHNVGRIQELRGVMVLCPNSLPTVQDLELPWHECVKFPLSHNNWASRTEDTCDASPASEPQQESKVP